MKDNAFIWTSYVLACSLGVFLGWQFGGDPAVSVPVADIPAKTRSTERMPSPHSVDIAQIRNSNSLRERLQMTINLAESIPVANIDAWLEGRWFNPGDGYETTLFTRILMDRRTLAVPEGTGDPTPAVMLESFLETVVCGMPEGETTEHAEMLELFAMLAEKDPAALEAALGELIIPYRGYAEEALLARRLATDFDVEIRKLWARPDGWLLFKNHIGDPDVLTKLFDDPAELPPSWRNAMAGKIISRSIDSSFAEFWWNADLNAAGFTGSQAEQIRKEALSGIARDNPEKAIPLLDAVEFGAMDRKKFIQSIFARGGLSDADAAKLLARLRTDEDRQHAHEQLERKRR